MIGPIGWDASALASFYRITNLSFDLSANRNIFFQSSKLEEMSITCLFSSALPPLICNQYCSVCYELAKLGLCACIPQLAGYWLGLSDESNLEPAAASASGRTCHLITGWSQLREGMEIPGVIQDTEHYSQGRRWMASRIQQELLSSAHLHRVTAWWYPKLWMGILRSVGDGLHRAHLLLH